MQHHAEEEQDAEAPPEVRCEDADLDEPLEPYLGPGCAACGRHETPCWCGPDGP